MVLLFATVQKKHITANLLSNRGLLFLGFVSCPLNLIHNKLGIGLTAVIAAVAPLPSELAACITITIAIIIAIAWSIARYGEPVLSRLLRAWAKS